MLGTEFKNYEMTRVTLFRNRSREQLFFQELHALKASAPRNCDKEWTVVEDDTPIKEEKRQQLQAQVIKHFNEFSEKFGLLPKHENRNVNLSIAWWGKWPSAYFTNAQHGFFNLPAHLKLDPGYFGEGFYLTQYPRYSDYYISGCSLSSRKMKDGHILLCYAALGRPYPVTQDPYDPPGSQTILSSSLCGKLCGPQCGGAASHDCHYATVKMHADAKEFYPCPLRQQPDFDEIGAHPLLVSCSPSPNLCRQLYSNLSAFFLLHLFLFSGAGRRCFGLMIDQTKRTTCTFAAIFRELNGLMKLR
jgi:hypothetical protein